MGNINNIRYTPDGNAVFIFDGVDGPIYASVKLKRDYHGIVDKKYLQEEFDRLSKLYTKQTEEPATEVQQKKTTRKQKWLTKY